MTKKIRSVRFASSITKATDTYVECVTLIAFPRQQWLRYTYIVYLFISTNEAYS